MPKENEQINPLDPLTVGELISLTEAAQLSGLSATYLRTIAENGRLKAKKIGRNWLTTVTALEEYKSSRNLDRIPKKYRDRT